MRQAIPLLSILAVCLLALGDDRPVKGGRRQDPYDVPVTVQGKLPAGLDVNAVNWMTCSAVRSLSNYKAFPWTGRSAEKPHLIVRFEYLPENISGRATFNFLFPATVGTVTLNTKYRWSYFGNSRSVSLQSTLHHEVMHLIHGDVDHRIMRSKGIPEFGSYSRQVLNLWEPKKVQK